jgi:hypothetical protein
MRTREKNQAYQFYAEACDQKNNPGSARREQRNRARGDYPAGE